MGWVIAVAGMAGLVIFLASLMHKSSGEPSSRGHTLSYWLDQSDDQQRGSAIDWSPRPPQTPSQVEAAEAIRSMGTQAIPFLLQRLDATDTGFYEAKEDFLDYLHRKTSKTRYRDRERSPAQAT